MGVIRDTLADIISKFHPESKHDEVARLLKNICFEYRRVDDINPMPIEATRKREQLIRLLEKRHNFKFERDPNRDVLVFNSRNRIGVYLHGGIEVRIQGVKFTLEDSLEIFNDEISSKLDRIDDDMFRINELVILHKERLRRNILKNVEL